MDTKENDNKNNNNFNSNSNKPNEREIATYILLDLFEDRSYNNIILRQTLAKNKHLNRIQRAFVTEVVNGVLRNLIFIDHTINQFSVTKTKKMKHLILANLRCSVYQLKFMDKVPNSAVCNEAVKFTKKTGFLNLASFVNGVLRNIERNLDNITLPDETKKPLEYLAIKYSYPRWIVENFYYYLNKDYDKVKSIFELNNTPPKINICVNTLKTTANELKEKLQAEGVTVDNSNILKDYSLTISKTNDISKLESFKSGLFHVIDESAMLSCIALSPKSDEKILDVCAAPGGKSFFTSYLMENKGEIVSCDIFEHKIKLIEETKQRIGADIISPMLNDATHQNNDFIDYFHKVIVDAPCSGLGLVRKKPDIKISKEKEDIEELCELQKNILSNCAKYVKIGGELLYSTCTLTYLENEGNVKWFLANNDFEQIDVKQFLPQANFDKEKKSVTILPTDFGGDGFFIAKFKRLK